MLTRRGAALVAIATSITAAAVVLGSWVLALAAIPLVLMITSGFARAARAPAKLRATVTMASDRLLTGDALRAEVTLEHAGGTGGVFEVAARLHPFLETDDPPIIARLHSGKTITFQIEVRAPMRGRIPLGDLQVRERSLGAAWTRETWVELPASLTILPRWEELDDIPLISRRAHLTLGPHSTRRGGAGQEFFGLRPYLPGDTIDRVNWRQTAKRGRPIVNEYEQEAQTDIILLLDARERAQIGRGAHSTFESSIRAAVSISRRAQRARVRIGLIVLGPSVQWIPPAHGMHQHERIVEHLLDAFPAGDYDLSAAITMVPPNVLPKGATTILLTPSHLDSSIHPILGVLRARGCHPLILSPDSESSEIAGDTYGRRGEIAARLFRILRQRALTGLRAEGAPILDWDVRRPLAETLATWEATRP